MRSICIFLFGLLISGLATRVFAQAPGTIVTIAGGGLEDGDNVPATDVMLNRPLGMALDARGDLYIADTDNHRIRRIDATTGIITTVAGTGEPGFSGDGGMATNAMLHSPQAIAIDSAGNMYLSSGGAEAQNRRVRRVDPAGIITTVAGTGESGFDDAVPALEATFYDIVALAMLGDAALLISDGGDPSGQGNNRVRQLNLMSNTVGTVAGNGNPRASTIQDGGLAHRAGMTPGQLVIAGNGDLLIADVANGRVRRVSRAVQDTTVVVVINTAAGREAIPGEMLYKGDGGQATSALFANPSGIATDALGNIYIADTGNHRIRTVEAETGVVLPLAGTGIAGAGSDGALGLLSDLQRPTRLLIDGQGDLIFIDDNRIRKLRDPTFRMPLFNATAAEIDFGNVSIGDPVVRGLPVENRGNLPVRIDTVVADNAEFRVLSASPFDLGIAQMAEIELAFDPIREGRAQGIVTLTTDDPRMPSAAVRVQGVGEAAAIGLFPPDVLVFDPTPIGQSQSSSVRISNLGAGVLVVSHAATTDSQFVVEQTDTLRIASGQSGDFRIAFRPTTENVQRASLTIFSNAPATPAATLQLQGLGQRGQTGGFADVSSNLGMGDSGAGFGAAWGDFDNDGDLDLSLVRSREPNRLYRNDGTGFTDVAPALGVDDPGDGSAGIWGDVDRDGDLDLYVTNFGEPNRLYRNDGARFTDVAPAFGVDDPGDGYGAAWADYDRDGDLDLYVANFGANRFFQNEGHGFVERADSLGLADMESGIQPAWGDFDNDGDPDLFLANSGPNRLYRNDGDRFAAVENGFSPTDAGPSFGAAWGDFDNDGDLDLFIPYFGANNRLYVNDGGRFTDRAPAMGLDHDGQSRGAAWGDFDNDGFLDLYVTNRGQPNVYYKNREGQEFIELADTLGLAHSADSRGLALADYDADGKLDLYIAVQNGPDVLYRNREADGNWIAVRVRGTQSSADAIGTRIEMVYGDDRRAIREISGGASFLSQDAPIAWFGIGKAERVSVLSLRWPGGIVQQLRGDTDDLAINRIIDITEQLPQAAARVRLTADATSMLGNGISETELTAHILTRENRPVVASGRAVRFRIETGSGLIIPSPNSEQVGEDAIAVRDGVATSRYRAGRDPGRVVIVAESQGLAPGRVEIELIRPFAEDVLTLRTIAGSGGEIGGFAGDGGAATDALLQNPQGIAADSLGNIYIADTGNNRVRRIGTETGIIQTLAGQEEDLAAPSDVVFSRDALIVSETQAHGVRQIRNGALASFAGTGIGQFGGDGGRASDANLGRPTGLAVDPSGDLYIADTDNHRIRKVDLQGIITTFAGSGNPDEGTYAGDNGAATRARLNRPRALAIDAQNNVYIADTDNHRIRKVDPQGIIATLAGTGTPGFSGDGGTGARAQLNRPQGIAVDGRGYLYIADTDNHRIRLLNLNNGLIQSIGGTGLDQLDLETGGGLAVSLNAPRGLAISPTGTLLIADAGNHRIRELAIAFDSAIAASARTKKTTDFNADGRVDRRDFFLFAQAFATAAPRFDLDADGTVGFADFLRFVRVYEARK